MYRYFQEHYYNFQGNPQACNAAMEDFIAAIENLPDHLRARFRRSFMGLRLPSRARQQTTNPAPTPSTSQASEPVDENRRVLPAWMQRILAENQASSSSSGWLSVRRTPSNQAQSTDAPPTPTSSRRPNILRRSSEQPTSRPVEEEDDEDVFAFPPPQRN